MRAADIHVGDTLELKRDNPYGMPPVSMQVVAVTYKDGYLTPWIHTSEGAFRPKDFKGHARTRI